MFGWQYWTPTLAPPLEAQPKMPTDRWRQLLEERLHEAITVLGWIPGVQGFIVAGSLGPFSA